VPLTRLYRLGASPHRIRKGYVIAGAADAVLAFRRDLNGRAAAREVVLEAPEDSPRAVTLTTGWWWLHDQASREAARAALTEAVVNTASAAYQRGCWLLPGAVRPDSEVGWSDWTVGDHHSVGLLDDVEREVGANLFRTHVPEIIALTGHPGIGPTPEPLGSRRLADSGQHLAARYLTSTSPRHLSLVESELRRTTGIRDLRTMDVHPLDPPCPGGAPGSLGVRCVDSQAFTGTAIAHAILFQALTMAARRRVRDGRREGNTDQRLLERRRTAAILKGIDARVPTETVQRKPGDRGGPQTSGQVSFDVLVLELIEALVPELGTLEASFAEFAPVIAWTAALAESSIPRTEAELLAQTLRGADGASHEIIGRQVGAADWHAPELFLHAAPGAAARLRMLGQQWETRLTQPPSAGEPRSHGSRPGRPDGRNEGGRKPDSRNEGGRKPDRRPGGESALADRVRRLAELPEGAVADHAGLVAALAGELTAPSAELVPWLGSRHKELVTTARRRLRPPGECQVSCSPGQLRPGSSKVKQASQVARDKGVAMLRVTAEAAEKQPLVDAAAGLVSDPGVPGRFVLLAVNSFTRGDGELVSVDLLVLPEGNVT
jgi:hypothetical protein